MLVADIIKNVKGRNFSVEVLPPLKGHGTERLFRSIDRMMDYNPLYVNITNHHSEYIYTALANGQYERSRVQRRPGSVAIAGALNARYDVPIVPHVICSGITREKIEYELLDLEFLGIDNLLLLRGDKAREDKVFVATEGGYEHTTELIEQVAQYNEGYFLDGSKRQSQCHVFSFGVACYPEKHDEAPNVETDLGFLLRKQALGAEYAVTQMFFDNEKFFSFLERARHAGVTIPIIPGVKPLTALSQLTVLPKTFHIDIPRELALAAAHCKNDDEAKALGIEWGVEQCRQLYESGITNIHLYTMAAVDSVVEIVKRVCHI